MCRPSVLLNRTHSNARTESSRSGSMTGQPMAAANAALKTGLGLLSPRDQFNIIAFDHEQARSPTACPPYSISTRGGDSERPRNSPPAALHFCLRSRCSSPPTPCPAPARRRAAPPSPGSTPTARRASAHSPRPLRPPPPRCRPAPLLHDRKVPTSSISCRFPLHIM